MIDKAIIDSINKLKEQVSDKDYDISAEERVLLWEKRIEELNRIDDYSKLQTTIEIVKEIRGRIRTLVIERMSCKVLKDINILDLRIKELSWFLKLLTPNYQSELDDLHKIILNEIVE